MAGRAVYRKFAAKFGADAAKEYLYGNSKNSGIEKVVNGSIIGYQSIKKKSSNSMKIQKNGDGYSIYFSDDSGYVLGRNKSVSSPLSLPPPRIFKTEKQASDYARKKGIELE